MPLGAIYLIHCYLPFKGCVIAAIKSAVIFETPKITKPRCKRNACFSSAAFGKLYSIVYMLITFLLFCSEHALIGINFWTTLHIGSRLIKVFVFVHPIIPNSIEVVHHKGTLIQLPRDI